MKYFCSFSKEMSGCASVSRKHFLKVTGIFAGLSLLISASDLAKPDAKKRTLSKSSRSQFRIRALPGRCYSPAFLKLCERGVFASVKQAVRSARGCRQPFEVYCEPLKA